MMVGNPEFDDMAARFTAKTGRGAWDEISIGGEKVQCISNDFVMGLIKIIKYHEKKALQIKTELQDVRS